MKLFFVVLLLFSPLLFATTPEVEALNKFTQSSNQFGFQLWKHLQKNKDSLTNQMFSPFSLESALTLARLGASGKTAKEMGDALHLPTDLEKIQIGYWQAIRHLNGEPQEKRGFELKVANALWMQIDFPFLPNYLNLATKTFQADLKSVDYRKNTEEVRKEINRWVNDKTNGKIVDIVPPDQLSPSSRLTLTNAVYFKGQWTHPFEKTATKPDRFHLKGKIISVPFMNKTEQFKYLESDGAQIVELPYRGTSLVMLVAIPKEIEGLKNLENKLNAELLKTWTERTEYKRVALSLPSFKFETMFNNIEKPLKEMGMRLPFTPEADFSAMTKSGNFSIDSVAHKTFIAVDEAGTEAAAATAVTYKMTAAFEGRPLIVKADRPFLFFIKDVDTGLILFCGHVVDPK